MARGNGVSNLNNKYAFRQEGTQISRNGTTKRSGGGRTSSTESSTNRTPKRSTGVSANSNISNRKPSGTISSNTRPANNNTTPTYTNNNSYNNNTTNNNGSSSIIGNIGNTIGDIADSIGDIITGESTIQEELDDWIERMTEDPLGQDYAEKKNSQSLQESFMEFSAPFKTQAQLEKLHLKQLVTTWEAIRVGEFNYLLHQNPPGGGGGGNNAGSGAYSGQYAGTNQEIVWQFLTGAGFSKESTAGMMGNIEWESGFKTDKIEAGSGIGFGLIQWSHDRRKLIEKKASKDNKDIHDIHFQLEYLLEELESGSYWNFPSGVYTFSFNMSYNEFKTTSNIDKATEAFCWCFEKPAEKTAKIDKRKEAAHKYYNEFKDATFGGAYTGDATGLAAALVRECERYNGLNYTQNTNPAAGPTRYGPTHYDCSSLLEKMFKDVAGVDIGTTTQVFNTNVETRSGFGTKIPPDQAQAGDIYYWPGHVAMSVGGGRQFHAANEELGIMYQKYYGGASYAFRIAQLSQPSNTGSSGGRNTGGRVVVTTTTGIERRA